MVSASGKREIATFGFLFVLIVGLLAGTISGIVGTGSSIMLMPVLVYQCRPRRRAVHGGRGRDGELLAHSGRWGESTGAPASPIGHRDSAAALGARTLLALPSHAVDIAIGVFLIAMVPVRHWLARHQLTARLWHLAVGGAVIGYLAGIVVSTARLGVPLFLFFFLAKLLAFSSPPEPAVSLRLYLSKSIAFSKHFRALMTPDITMKALIADASLMFGAFIARTLRTSS